MSAEIRETHSAVVVLCGDRATKFKKPVDLGFLDFRSVQARREALRRELELNRRLAPDVYLDVATVVGSTGDIVDHILLMRRMPEAARLSTLVTHRTGHSRSELQDRLRQVARVLADFHSRAERGPHIDAEAGAHGLRRRWTDNFAELERYVGTSVDAEMLRHIRALALDYVDGRAALFERRRAAQVYVDGHGDVTADDVFCLDDHPRILDCIEFDDRLRWIDALDDAAFLAMELEHLAAPELARYFLDQYAEFSAVPRVPSLEHHYLAYRALVRAKIACLQAEAGAPDAQSAVDSYLEATLRHLEAGQVRLMLVGGAPGTGKSTIAAAVADRLGAVLLSTDVLRQQLTPGDAHYDDTSRTRVYRTLLARARHVMANGESVVADATWPTRELRAEARAAASDARSALLEFECHAPPRLAAARAQRRLETAAGPSEAGGVVALTLARRRAAWPSATSVDCTGSPEEALRDIADVLAFPCPK